MSKANLGDLIKACMTEHAVAIQRLVGQYARQPFTDFSSTDRSLLESDIKRFLLIEFQGNRDMQELISKLEITIGAPHMSKLLATFHSELLEVDDKTTLTFSVKA